MTDEELLKKGNIQKIADKGARIYAKIKAKYDPKEKGKFLAIDVDSKEVYLGKSTADVLQLARRSHPDSVFYVVKIGFDVVETMAKYFLDNK